MATANAEVKSENPCSFKPACKTCKIVPTTERPMLCEAGKCPEYTPCSKCKRNVPLYKDKKCASCTKEDVVPELHVPTRDLPPTVRPAAAARESQEEAPRRKFSVTVPGQAPPEYNDEERAYYDQQWQEYYGFFRDPTAYPICHSIIILEIELNHAVTEAINARIEDADEGRLKAIHNRQEKISDMLTKMRNQLPDKEAMEFSEEEQALCAIYERYAAEQLKRKVAGVSRVLSPEAIALAPCLHFPVGLADILTRLGYKSITIESAFERVQKEHQLPKDPIHLLESLGMFIKEKVIPMDTIAEGSHSELGFEEEEDSEESQAESE